MRRALGVRRWALLGAALAAPSLCFGAETNTGAAATLDPLEVMGQGARPLAMGSAFTAVKGDLMASLFNPAGQAFLRGTDAAANHNAWIGGINQDSLAAVVAGDALSVGLYGDLINYGSIDQTDAAGNVTGSYNPMSYTLGLCLAKEFSGGLGLGATVRGSQLSVEDAGVLSSSADLGLMWSPPGSELTLGLAYDGVGLVQSGVQNTAALRLGGSLDVPFSQRSGVLFAFGASGLNNGAGMLQAGVEGRLGGHAFMRLGYQASFMDNQTGGMTGLSAGLGAVLGPLVVDYAFLPYGRVGNSNRVSLSYQFESAREASAPTAAAVPAAAPTKAAAPAPHPAAAAPAPSAPAPSSASKAASDAAGVDLVFSVPISEEEDRLRQAVQADPADAAAWNRLGRWCFDHQQFKAMHEAYQRYLQLRPGDQATADWLAKVEQTLR